MPKKINKKIWIIILIAIALFYFGSNDQMSFYHHRECFVSETQMGCEAGGMAITLPKTNTCVDFMMDNGCQPENCQYYGNAVCGVVYSEKDMIGQECYTDKECVDKFQHTGYWCFKDHLSPLDKNSNPIGFCKFEGNHLPKDSVFKTFGFEDFNFDEFAEENKTLFAILGGIFLVWFLIFTFSSEERPPYIR